MRKLLKAVLFLAIIGVGVLAFWYLVSSKNEPLRAAVEEMPVLVETIAARASDEPMIISATGTVVPARSVTVIPEVNGRVVYVSPQLTPGGRLRRGQALVRIDPRDYDLSIKQQQARVMQAEMEMAREQGLKSVAEREWSLIRDQVQPTAEGKKLALHEIQLKNAQAALASAESTLEQARLQRERTVIRAPFNALVTEELVDVGQVVAGSSRIATLVDSDVFWVRVELPVDRIESIDFPGLRGATRGSPVIIDQQTTPGHAIERGGQVVRLLSDLDPKGKMARLLVEVDNPMGSGKSDGQGMPLLLGSYVAVKIRGPRAEGVIALPRRALRESGQVWVLDPENKLQIRHVAVIWARDEDVFVRGELRPGEKVITSRIAAPVAGMRLSSLPDKAGDKPSPSGAERPS
ncbi:MAG TPA: efflux RND transporter periplasmic adaptor subunit [Myxococcota bacterium]|nr:efflux RND transporter periplasmic adaptor subunit [Myxococcota bacterium]